MLAFEIFIPLVLFFILLGLRQKKPTIPVKEGECQWGGAWGTHTWDHPEALWSCSSTPGTAWGRGPRQLVGTQRGLLVDIVLGRGCSQGLAGVTGWLKS